MVFEQLFQPASFHTSFVNNIAILISIVGGIAGILSFLWILRKKIWGKVSILHSTGYIHRMSTSSLETPLGIDAFIVLANKKDAPVAITDIFGTLRYDKQEYANNALNKRGFEERLSSRPTVVTPHPPINLNSDEVVELKLHFEFEAVYFISLERYRTAHFVGFVSGAPLVSASNEHKTTSPLRMLLTVDAGGEILTSETPIFNNEEEMKEHGTIDLIKMAKIEKNWR